MDRSQICQVLSLSILRNFCDISGKSEDDIKARYVVSKFHPFRVETAVAFEPIFLIYQD